MKIKYLLFPAVLAVAVIVYLRFGFAGDVKGPEARRMVAAGAKLIDVRSPEEFRGGHLPGAVNIPFDTLEDRLNEVGPKTAHVILYCRSGIRSLRATAVLQHHGFENVHNLGPMRAW